MEKIIMKTPLVEMDGDEMTRILWKQIKDELICPFVELKTEYYDLGLVNRDNTDDAVTTESALATQRLGVAVKCATITPNLARQKEYNLKKLYKSPNATIRSILDGTVFREPILCDCVKPVVRGWKKPIVIARHAYGDIYKSVEIRTCGKGDAFLTFKGENGEISEKVFSFEGDGILQAVHNTDSSMRAFAEACFAYALELKQDLWFSSKDTISKTYDGRFNQVFEDVYEEYRERFATAGIKYFYTLIDDAIARVIRSEGGFVWACKNYDGDVFSDMLSTAFGSLAMMTSVLVSPKGCFEYEAAHGTVTRHYYKYLKGEQTSTNPVATIFAWTGALKKRGALDKQPELVRFGEQLEAACLQTINGGIVTKDLALLAEGQVTAVNTTEFIGAIATALRERL